MTVINLRTRTPPPEPDTPGDFNRTDMGNAERFIAEHGADVHYLPVMGSWLVWDGRRWQKDEDGAVERRAHATVRGMLKEAAESPEPERRAGLSKHAVASESAGRLKAMLEIAKSLVGPKGGTVTRPLAHFDADPWKLPVANGTIDLRSGDLLPHRREDLARKLVDVPLDPNAQCPRWLSFLDRILGGSAGLIQYVQRAVGYSLTGDTGEQCLFFLHGRGANGKTTFLETIRLLLGEFATQTDFSTLADSKRDGPRNDVARLERARLVISSEVAEGKRLNEELVKSLTGNETVTARYLHHEFFEFRPEFKLWLAGNHKPVIRGTDDGIWRRVRLLPFEVQIPEAERDPTLGAALRAELPGILSWALDGCLDWQLSGLVVPDEVRAATQAYREESDVLGAWIASACALELGDPETATQASLLYANYRRWAEDGGEYVMSQTAFGRRLSERGIVAEPRGTGAHRLTWRLGIRLTQGALA